MVQVPITSRNQVERAPLRTGALQYSAPRNLVGPAIERLGETIGQAADAFDEIEAAKDQAYAVDGDNAAAIKASEVSSRFKSLRGDMPDRELPGALKEFDDLQEKLLSEARSERSRSILKRNLEVRRANLQNSLTAHADDQMFKFREGALSAGRDQARNDAIAAAGTEQFGVALGTGLTRVAERGKLAGWSAEEIQLENTKFQDEVHGGVIDTMFAVPDPDIDAIGGYVESYGAQMTPRLKNQILARLQNPLEQRVARSDVDSAMGFARPAEGEEAKPTPAVAARPIAMEMLREFEGFREGTYWDVNHHRVGYGSDTITTASGQVRTVKQGDRVSRADAERDLERRTGKLEQAAAKRAGSGWERLPAGARAAIVSVAYNYGEAHDRLDPLWAAAAKGDANAVAKVIEGFAGDNNGINRDRRLREAEAARNGGGYESSPREWDRAQVYDNLEALAARDGWTPERLERARSEADKRIARDEGLLREKREDADEAAADIVAQKGDTFRTHMIPREVWNTLTPVQQREYQDIEKELTKPKEPEANGPRQIELALMRVYEPEKFASLNLAKETGRMTRAELATLLEQQAKMRTADPKVFEPRAGIVTALNYGKKINALELEPEQEAAILSIMEAEANRLHASNGGKPLTELDYQALFRSATRDVATRGFLGRKGSKARFDLTLDNMPDTQRARLTKRLRDSGLPVTEANLLRLYRLEAR